MDPKLEKKLIKKYPILFGQSKMSIRESAMPWGCQHGNGWFNIIDQLCSWLTHNMTVNKHLYPKIQFTTIKEKYGTLRLYFDALPSKVDHHDGYEAMSGAISLVESMSQYICEECGQPGKLREDHHWYLTRCDKCFKEYENGRKNV